MNKDDIRETILTSIRNTLAEQRKQREAILDRPEPMGSSAERNEWWRDRQEAMRNMGGRQVPYTPDEWFGGLSNSERIAVSRELEKMHREGVVIRCSAGGNRTTHVRLGNEVGK